MAIRNWGWDKILAVVGAGAGVVAMLAALAVFVWPTADGRLSHDDATRQAGETSGTGTIGTPPSPPTTPTASPGGEATATSTSRPDPADDCRLVALKPVTGIGSATSEGDDLVVHCPGNQSDDRYREVRYDLVAPYVTLTGGVAVTGPGDPDATAAVQVFIQHRQERSDRTVEVTRAVVRAGAPAKLTAQLGDAVSVVLRVTCAVPEQTVTITNPRLTR